MEIAQFFLHLLIGFIGIGFLGEEEGKEEPLTDPVGLSVASFITLLEHTVEKMCIKIIVESHCCNSEQRSLLDYTDATVTSYHIIPITLNVMVSFDVIVAFIIPLVTLLTSSPLMWRGEHLWNFSVLQRTRFSSIESYTSAENKLIKNKIYFHP
jgi:hypothetical protein